jgi:hypothetical protein
LHRIPEFLVKAGNFHFFTEHGYPLRTNFT